MLLFVVELEVIKTCVKVCLIVDCWETCVAGRGACLRLSLGQLAICQLQNPSKDLLANSVVSRVSKLSLNLVRPR